LHRAPVTASGPGQYLGHVVTVRDVGRGPEPGRLGAFTEGTWWNVRSTGEPLAAGTRARVVGQDGLTLLVEPILPEDFHACPSNHERLASVWSIDDVIHRSSHARP
jgi:membrane-bound ClpP family serine protease